MDISGKNGFEVLEPIKQFIPPAKPKEKTIGDFLLKLKLKYLLLIGIAITIAIVLYYRRL